MKYFKITLFLSIGFNLIVSFFIVKNIYCKYYPSNSNTVKDEKKTQISYFLNRQKLFEVLPRDSNSIIFLGNSLTKNFELAEHFHNVNIKNRGISGDITAGVLNRLRPIILTQPKKYL